MPPPQIAEAQFTDDTVEGLGFRVADVVEGQTDGAGKFRFAVGRPVEFFIGNGSNRLVIGSATLAATAANAVPFSLQDLAEVQNDGDQYLGKSEKSSKSKTANNSERRRSRSKVASYEERGYGSSRSSRSEREDRSRVAYSTQGNYGGEGRSAGQTMSDNLLLL